MALTALCDSGPDSNDNEGISHISIFTAGSSLMSNQDTPSEVGVEVLPLCRRSMLVSLY